MTPYVALDRLRSSVETGAVAELGTRHGLDLLMVHGSVLDPEPLRAAADLDVAFRHRVDASRDVVGLVDELMELTGFDRIDPLDLRSAGVVAQARALGPDSLVLYEATPGTFATAQMAAITIEMDTRHLRRLDLELMAGR
ncbi:hypothetical protein GIY23_03680 [Allosaccharopolyspora coralli]|uniref:Nucleotidyltransferase domain-containing protein n=1 Tax=Allosaccharopolyspora coralli TaxID=2665642 RepID=A0A5Q3Q2F5_9PSEU|nr:hypothetical protein [Allosaccharopolyspora coralli]QGK68768.1 hypothetical protein GIY23_03680 [Allosaccharopolyspora coralli]